MDDIVKDYGQRRLLNIDQYLETRGPIPSFGELRTYPRLLHVVDKGSSAIVVRDFVTVDDKDKQVFYNETTVMIRGSRRV